MSWLPVTWLSWAERFSAQAACFLISKRNVLIEQDPKVPPCHACLEIMEGFRSIPCCLAILLPFLGGRELFLRSYSPYTVSWLCVLLHLLNGLRATIGHQFQAKLKWIVLWFKQINFCLQRSRAL